jgi:trehalose-6-phosphate synthase
VTPLRDSMNLIAKEYVSAQDAENPGVLILSRFAGAAVELEAALLVNPYDPESVGTAIARALSMPLDERRTRHDAMFQVLLANDVKLWGDSFLINLTRPPNFPLRLAQMNFAQVDADACHQVIPPRCGVLDSAAGLRTIINIPCRRGDEVGPWHLPP